MIKRISYEISMWSVNYPYRVIKLLLSSILFNRNICSKACLLSWNAAAALSTHVYTLLWEIQFNYRGTNCTTKLFVKIQILKHSSVFFGVRRAGSTVKYSKVNTLLFFLMYHIFKKIRFICIYTVQYKKNSSRV